MQQMAARQIGRLAQVEIERPIHRFHFEAQAFLLLVEIVLQRHQRRAGGNAAEPIPDGQGAVNQPHRGVIAQTDHGAQGLIQFIQTRLRPFAQGRQGFGQPHRFDDVSRGTIQPFLAEQPRRPRQPADRSLFRWRLPQMFVPTGRSHTRAVTAGAAEVAIRPRRPGGGNLDAGQPFQQIVVRLGGGQLGQRRNMPRAADHGDPAKTILLRLPQTFAHVRLAQVFTLLRRRRPLRAGRFRAHRGHRLADGGEQLQAVAPFLNQMIPPAFAVAITGGAAQPVERIESGIGFRRFAMLGLDFSFIHRFRRIVVRFRRIRRDGFRFRRREGELMAHRQIDEAGRDAVRQAVMQRVPFRRKYREGIKRRLAGIVRVVDQQCNRRLQIGVGDDRQHRLAFRRAFDQQAIGLQTFQRLDQTAGATRPVVADAEQVERGVSHIYQQRACIYRSNLSESEYGPRNRSPLK